MKAKQSKLDLFAEQLDGWFGDEKITLDEAKERLAGLGCKVGRDRLSVWWQQRQSARLQERLLGQIASGARHVKEVESAFGKSPAPALETIMNLHRVLALQLATASATNPDMIELAERCTRMVLEFAKLEQKRKEVSLDERRLEESLKTKIESGLDELASMLKKHPDLLKEYQDWREKFSARIAA